MLHGTLRNVWAHRARYGMSTLAVVLSVMFMSATLLLTGGLGRDGQAEIASANSGVEAVVRGEKVAGGEGGPGEQGQERRVPVSAAALAKVRKAPGVAAADGAISGYAQLSRGSRLLGQTEAAANVGSNWIQDRTLNPFHLTSGRAPRTPGEVVVDAATARRDGIEVGDPLRVSTVRGRHHATVTGIARYGDAAGPLGRSAVLFPATAAEQLLGRAGEYEHLVARAADGNREQLATAIRGALPERRLEVLTGAAYTAELQGAVSSSTTTIQLFLTVFALVALVVGGTLIHNTFSAAVAQRTRELALLRALGATTGQVTSSVLLEAVVIGALGSAVGIGFGGFASATLGTVLGSLGLPIPLTGSSYTVSTVVFPLLTGFGATVVSAFVPALRAGRLAPVAALRDAQVDDSASGPWRNLLGVGAVMAGCATAVVGGLTPSLVIVGVGASMAFAGVFVSGPAVVTLVARTMRHPLRLLAGRMGTLTGRGTQRNPRRAAATAHALMLAVAVVVFFTVLAASFSRTTADTTTQGVRSDFVVSSIDADAPLLPEGLADRIDALSEIGTTSEVHSSEGQVNRKGAKLGGVDPATIGSVWNFGITSGSVDSLRKGQLLVDARSAEESGVVVGRRVAVTMPDGALLTATVGGLFTHSFGGFDAPTHLLPDQLYRAHAVDRSAAWILADTRAGVAQSAARTALDPVLKDQPTAKLQTAADWAHQGNAEVFQFRNMMYALDALAILIALLGIANTLSLAVLQRTRELGLLRALGSTRAQLRRMINGEALLLGVQGAVTGLLLGLGGAWALYKGVNAPDMQVLVLPALPLTGIVLGGVTAALLVTLLPAWRAGRVDPLRAIATE
ncbi:ABC transporter permease [Streptomyces tubercidicus]|uniref:ABC transporter permease n=1 Tax=Streptomyces tubercidicus TaxID=47759 RepID=UPI003467E832